MARTVVALSMLEWRVYLRKLGSKLVPAARKGVRRGALEGVSILQRKSSAMGVMNYGTYKRGWQFILTPRGAILYNNTPYAGVIEWGRRLGARQPPAKVLARWAQRKFRISFKKASKIAFALARSIKERGIRGRPVMTSSFDALQLAVHRGVMEELGKVMVSP